MSPFLALRLVTYLLVFNGIAALFLAGLIGPPGAALVVLAILGSWWLERARERGAVRPALAWGLVATAAAAIAADLVYLASTALDGMVHVLLFLIVARLFMRRGLRDLRDAGFLSFFLLVATSSVTFGMGFVLVFIGFMLLGTWMLMLHHIVAESERAPGTDGGGAPARVAVGNPLTRVSLIAVAATFAISSILFFVIPRVGQATLPLRTQLGRMVSGFSDRVELGAFGEIEPDKTVVMRVYMPDSTIEPSALPNLRWRGMVFDRFDGRTWAVGAASRSLVRRTAGGHFQLGTPRGRGPVVKQDIYLDPIGTDVVFAASRALSINLTSGGMSVDDMGSLSALSMGARLHYQVESELELAPTRAPSADSGPPLTGPIRARYLQLPAISPGIARLAREIVAGSQDPYEAAIKLNHHLFTRFRYTLAKPQTTLEPLEEFLFIRRSGNCEYFAASLAVMLRALDIPARLVGGFQRGDWNPYGRYFMVRMSDAHAWVEAYFPGRGWVTFDPTPRDNAAVSAEPSSLSLYLDAARMRWYRYVINWSLQDQRLVASTVHRQARDAKLAFGWPKDWLGYRWMIFAATGLAAGAIGWFVWRYTRPVSARPAAGSPPRFYDRALRALARRGLSPALSETARQFRSRAGASAPDCAAPLERLTTAYERARFGQTPPSEEELQELERCVLALESG